VEAHCVGFFCAYCVLASWLRGFLLFCYGSMVWLVVGGWMMERGRAFFMAPL
jgi:hypothetical protein